MAAQSRKECASACGTEIAFGLGSADAASSPPGRDEPLTSLTEHQLLLGLVALALILLFGRAAGEIARRLHQPEVLGQLLAGFLLGPSVFGALLPSLYHDILLNSAVGTTLSGFSWVGAILLLLVAGVEVDLTILRREARPGILTAAFAIIPSLIAGSLFAWLVLGKAPSDGLFLGVVLSVTAVSVASTILIERETMRREWAQVILAAGVASEVMVWLFVSVVSAVHGSSPLLAGIRSAAFAIGFFLLMMTVGRRLLFWSMRRVRDVTVIAKGQLSLILVLAFIAAAITQSLGLHALLGAFVFGVLLGRAPRSNEELTQSLQSLTIGVFGPIFFVLAGTRVDIFRLGSLSSIGTILLLFVVATAVKAGFSALGAKIGGRTGWESLLVGVGMNLKGGTDVVVAVIGTELGLLSVRVYSMYAVVGILTVMVSPVLINVLERKTPPAEAEQQRLESEEAERRAYVPTIERVLVPMEKNLLPSLAAGMVERIATSKHEQGQIFDITQFDVGQGAEPAKSASASEANDRLDAASALDKVEVTQHHVVNEDTLTSILDASKGYDLVAIGARPPKPEKLLTLGRLQDAIIHQAEADVLVAIDHDAAEFSCSTLKRILVPINGLEHSMAAGDIAGSLAGACDAEIVLLHVVHSDVEEEQLQHRDRWHLEQNAESIMDELAFRVGRLGVEVEKKVESRAHAGEAIVDELCRNEYQLVVLGGIDRGQNGRPYLGRAVRTVLMRTQTPVVLLVTRGK